MRPGISTSRSALKTDLAAIYATGWFSDVRIQPTDGPLGVRLVVNVTPNPVLKEVVLNNPKALLPKERINDVFASDYGRTLNLKSLDRRMVELQKWYAEQGYSLARISGPTRVSPEGVVELSVREGTVEAIEVQFLNANGDATDEKGKPMHKSSGNAIEFNEAADKAGADTMRWVYARQRYDDNLLFGYNYLNEVRRSFILPLWNAYSFFVTYANIDKLKIENLNIS